MGGAGAGQNQQSSETDTPQAIAKCPEALQRFGPRAQIIVSGIRKTLEASEVKEEIAKSPPPKYGPSTLMRRSARRHSAAAMAKF
eukprot:scaffold419006_cov36-Prasinocladus_malaysianus.AAC.1